MPEFAEYKNLILDKFTSFEKSITELKDDIHELHNKLDEVQGSYYANCPLKPDIQDHETRIRELERGYWKATGIMIAVSTFVISSIEIIFHYIK